MSFFLQPLQRLWHAFSCLGILGSSLKGTGRRAEPLPYSKEKGGGGIPYWDSCSQRQCLTSSSPAFSTQSRGGREIWVTAYSLCILEVLCRQSLCPGSMFRVQPSNESSLCAGEFAHWNLAIHHTSFIVWIKHMRFFFEKLCCGKSLLRPCSMKSVSQKSTHPVSIWFGEERVTLAV